MTTKQKKPWLSVGDLALCALFAALLAVCAWLSLHLMEISFTMQTFAVFLACGLLGGKRATVACLVYLLLGAVGLPVFTGFQSGPSALLGVTGGYLFGFVASCLMYWLITSLLGQKPWVQLMAMVIGMLACYALGTAWFLLVYTKNSGTIGLLAVLSKCVIPFLLPDLCKIALAFLLTCRLRRFIPAEN